MDARNMDLLTFLQGPKPISGANFPTPDTIGPKVECEQLWDDVLACRSK